MTIICKSCAFEADGKLPQSATCHICGRNVIVITSGTGGASLSWRERPRLRRHRPRPGPTGSCEAGGKAAVWGHAACPGCDCHHRTRSDG